MLERRQDWPERLFALIEARRDTPFAWGEHDCCSFAADAILEMAGTDPIADLRSDWDDEVSALRLLKEHGGIETLATERLGPPIDPAFAQRGDVVLHMLTGREALGVCVGDRFVAVADARGVEFAPMSHAVRAWRV